MTRKGRARLEGVFFAAVVCLGIMLLVGERALHLARQAVLRG